MGTHQLIWDTFEEDTSLLIAVHSAMPSFKLAYLLNQHIDLRLHREERDISFTYPDCKALFPIFKFEDAYGYITYHLVKNNCSIEDLVVYNSQELFENHHIVTKHLVPENPKVDYFLKVSNEVENFPILSFIQQIQKIPQVVTAYELAQETLKSKNNLIFE